MRAVWLDAHVEMPLAGWAERDEDEPGEVVDGRLVEDVEPVLCTASSGSGWAAGVRRLAIDVDALWAEVERLSPESGG